MDKIEEIRNKIYSINDTLKPLFKGTCSVSNLCSYIKPEFDEKAQAAKCALKGKNNPDYKYYNMSEEEIIQLWHDNSDVSKKYGSLLDDYTSLILNKKSDNDIMLWKLDHNFDDDLRLKNTCTGAEQFIEWLLSNTNYIFLGREIPMYIQVGNNKINGRLDALFYDPNTDAYIIIDWKTTEGVSTSNSFNKKLMGPAYMLDDCDMNVYTAQLHLYKKALVETYKLTTYDKISVYVCNLLREEVNAKYYKLFPQNYGFNNILLEKIINFASMKYNILKQVNK